MLDFRAAQMFLFQHKSTFYQLFSSLTSLLFVLCVSVSKANKEKV